MTLLPIRRANGGSSVASPETIFDRFFEGGWDPFSEISNLRRTMNMLFDSALRPSVPGALATGTWVPAIDLYEKDGNYVVECALPGIKKEDVDIEVDENSLTLSTKHTEEKVDENTRYHYREMRRGSFSRRITFPYDIDPNKVTADFQNGVLKITVPASKTHQAKKVAIKG